VIGVLVPVNSTHYCASIPGLSTPSSIGHLSPHKCGLEISSRSRLPAYMLSAVIHPERSQPAMLLAEQLAHQRLVHPGPLVLRTGRNKFHTHAADIHTTVS